MTLSDLRARLAENPDLVIKVKGCWLLALSEAHSRLLDEQRVPTRAEVVDGSTED